MVSRHLAIELSFVPNLLFGLGHNELSFLNFSFNLLSLQLQAQEGLQK